MSLLVVGMSYRTAPVALLEHATVAAEELPKTLHELLGSAHVSEALVLSTCNRVEVYADVDRFHGGVHDTSSVLARRAGVDVPELGQYVYVHYEDAAVAHLFSVAAGLDSMVVGESQILGQLRVAYATAAKHHALGRAMHDACQHALRVGKRAHTETGIDRAGASVVAVGLAEAERILGPLSTGGRRVLVVGAGSMGALAASMLRRSGVGELAVANRSFDRARRLATTLQVTGQQVSGQQVSGQQVSGQQVSGQQVSGQQVTGRQVSGRQVSGQPPAEVRAVELNALRPELAWADLVVTCTGATTPVVSYEMVEAAVADRAGRPLVLLDLALPRGVDGAAGTLPGVRYVDLAALQEPAGQMAHEDDVAAAAGIVAAEVDAYLTNQRATAVGPTVAALRARAAQVVDAELVRLDSRLPGLPSAVRDEVARAVHRVVQALLHAPTVRVKELAGRPGGDAYAAALRELFGLDPSAAAAVTSVVASPEAALLDAALLRAALPGADGPDATRPEEDR